jgi:hypothetical protein
MVVTFSSSARAQTKSQLEWRVAKPNHPNGLATTTRGKGGSCRWWFPKKRKKSVESF